MSSTNRGAVRARDAVLCGDEAAMRRAANYALAFAAVDADEPEPDRAICRLIAWTRATGKRRTSTESS